MASNADENQEQLPPAFPSSTPPIPAFPSSALDRRPHRIHARLHDSHIPRSTRPGAGKPPPHSGTPSALSRLPGSRTRLGPSSGGGDREKSKPGGVVKDSSIGSIAGARQKEQQEQQQKQDDQQQQEQQREDLQQQEQQITQPSQRLVANLSRFDDRPRLRKSPSTVSANVNPLLRDRDDGDANGDGNRDGEGDGAADGNGNDVAAGGNEDHDLINSPIQFEQAPVNVSAPSPSSTSSATATAGPSSSTRTHIPPPPLTSRSRLPAASHPKNNNKTHRRTTADLLSPTSVSPPPPPPPATATTLPAPSSSSRGGGKRKDDDLLASPPRDPPAPAPPPPLPLSPPPPAPAPPAARDDVSALGGIGGSSPHYQYSNNNNNHQQQQQQQQQHQASVSSAQRSPRRRVPPGGPVALQSQSQSQQSGGSAFRRFGSQYTSTATPPHTFDRSSMPPPPPLSSSQFAPPGTSGVFNDDVDDGDGVYDGNGYDDYDDCEDEFDDAFDDDDEPPSVQVRVTRASLRNAHNNGLKRRSWLQRLLKLETVVDVEAQPDDRYDSVFYAPFADYDDAGDSHQQYSNQANSSYLSMSNRDDFVVPDPYDDGVDLEPFDDEGYGEYNDGGGGDGDGIDEDDGVAARRARDDADIPQHSSALAAAVVPAEGGRFSHARPNPLHHQQPHRRGQLDRRATFNEGDTNEQRARAKSASARLPGGRGGGRGSQRTPVNLLSHMRRQTESAVRTGRHTGGSGSGDGLRQFHSHHNHLSHRRRRSTGATAASARQQRHPQQRHRNYHYPQQQQRQRQYHHAHHRRRRTQQRKGRNPPMETEFVAVDPMSSNVQHLCHATDDFEVSFVGLSVPPSDNMSLNGNEVLLYSLRSHMFPDEESDASSDEESDDPRTDFRMWTVNDAVIHAVSPTQTKMRKAGGGGRGGREGGGSGGGGRRRSLAAAVGVSTPNGGGAKRNESNGNGNGTSNNHGHNMPNDNHYQPRTGATDEDNNNPPPNDPTSTALVVKPKRRQDLRRLPKSVKDPNGINLSPTDVPLIHYDPVIDGNNLGTEPNSFVPVPASKGLYRQHRRENDAVHLLPLRFSVLEIDKVSTEQAKVIGQIDSVEGFASQAGVAVPYADVVSAAVNVVNSLGRRALKRYAKPDHILTRDFAFQLLSPELAAERERVLAAAAALRQHGVGGSVSNVGLLPNGNVNGNPNGNPGVSGNGFAHAGPPGSDIASSSVTGGGGPAAAIPGMLHPGHSLHQSSRMKGHSAFLRYGYYFFLSKPVDAKLYAQTDASALNVQLLLKRVAPPRNKRGSTRNGRTRSRGEKEFFPLSGVAYVVVRVSPGVTRHQRERTRAMAMENRARLEHILHVSNTLEMLAGMRK